MASECHSIVILETIAMPSFILLVKVQLLFSSSKLCSPERLILLEKPSAAAQSQRHLFHSMPAKGQDKQRAAAAVQLPQRPGRQEAVPRPLLGAIRRKLNVCQACASVHVSVHGQRCGYGCADACCEICKQMECTGMKLLGVLCVPEHMKRIVQGASM